MNKTTVASLKKLKKSGEKITCLTAYDASFAARIDQAGVELILVGDSLGMVVQGFDSTLPVTMDEMVYHTSLVSRATTDALVMADMPFMSYTNPQMALANAGRLIKEAGAQMVKLEGGQEQTATVSLLSEQNIPVCAHLGLQPQSINKIGSYRVQGREQKSADKMLSAALALQKAGADLLVLECVPALLARKISQSLAIPTIGIGAGVDCDGQVLVLYDLLGITVGKLPKFTKNYLTKSASVDQAIKNYMGEVKAGLFPDEEHSF